MTSDEALELVRALLTAPSEADLADVISRNLHRCDGIFFATAARAIEQLHSEGKPEIAEQLRDVTDSMARMRFLI